MRPNNTRRIDQFIPELNPYDAVGNHTMLMQGLLQKKGYTSDIFVQHLPKSEPQQKVRHYTDYEEYDSSTNIVIHQNCIGSQLPSFLQDRQCKVFNCFHNITPPVFFSTSGEEDLFHACHYGLSQLELNKTISAVNWPVSKYNRSVLISKGYQHNRCIISPLLRDYKWLSKRPNCPRVVSLLHEDRPVLLFVGRLAQNKAQHDIILQLRRLLDLVPEEKPAPLLILVGQGNAYYRASLFDLCKELKLKFGGIEDGIRDKEIHVVFTGSINDDALATLFRHATLFLCLSDHEGFCVPLVEAMTFGLPIAAHRQAAVEETLGSGGVVIDKYDFAKTSTFLAKLLYDSNALAELKQLSSQRANAYRMANLAGEFGSLLDQSIDLIDNHIGH